MKFYLRLFLCPLLFFSCVSDEQKRLQTDQSFEGEEMFNLSFSLDEHVSFAFNSFDYYKDSLNYEAIAGCPTVSINEEKKEVSLTFGEGECTTDKPPRKGKLVLSYIDSLVDDSLMIPKKLIRIGYEEYMVRGLTLKGSRYLEKLYFDSTQVTFQEETTDLLITDPNLSSSKISAVLRYDLVYLADSLASVSTTGSSSGRNLSGRKFEMKVLEPKIFSGECTGRGVFIPEAGQESWTFERTVEADVTHMISYQEGPECKNVANIYLYDGRELVKTQ